MARPSHKPDTVSRRQVEAMAACGVPEVDIARVVDIDPKTLRKHYRDELEDASAQLVEKSFGVFQVRGF
jgi:hypothetical protein